jgi:hypothetical protein
MPQAPPVAISFGREEEEESDDEEQHGSGHDELFKLEGGPVCFFLHESLTDGMKAQATKKIEAHGGRTTMLEKHAQIMLVSEARLVMPLETMERKYDVNPNPVLRKIFVKPLTFLNRCITTGFFQLGEKRIKKGMPGPRPREKGQVYRP